MKLFCICLVLIYTSLQVSSDTLAQEEKDCLKELNYEASVLEGAFDSMSNSINVNKKEVNDFMACAWRKYNKFTEDYQFNVPALVASLRYSVRKVLDYQGSQIETTSQSIVDGCIAELKTKDPGEQAVQMHNCFVRRIVYGPH